MASAMGWDSESNDQDIILLTDDENEMNKKNSDNLQFESTHSSSSNKRRKTSTSINPSKRNQEQQNSENLIEIVNDEDRNTSILPPALLNKYIQDVEANKQLNKVTASDEPIEPSVKKHPLSASNLNNNKKSNSNKKLSKLNEDELEELKKNNFDADGNFKFFYIIKISRHVI
jgi:hypothetical protein